MFSSLPRLIVFAALISVLGITPGAAQNGAKPDNVVQLRAGTPIPGQYIVVLRDDVADPAAVAAALARTHGLDVQFVYTSALKGFSASVPERAVAALRRSPQVAYVEQDQQTRVSAQDLPTGINRIDAEANAEITIDGVDDWRVDVDVAVIDTGVFDHPELDVVARADCSGGSPFKQSCQAGSGDDGNGHGTHVGGTIAGIDNGSGVVGVAPGARITSVKVLKDDGTGWASWLIGGVDWVTAQGYIEAANISIELGSLQALCDAIANSVSSGVFYGVAAGNSATDAQNTSPANCAAATAVSALADFDGLTGGLASSTCRTDEDDTLANFSNYGTVVDVIAPGVCIRSTWNDGGYNTISGTSMASPHVAGAGALLASTGMGPADIRSTILGEGQSDWVDQSGDGAQEPLLYVGNTTVFDPALVPGDGGAPVDAAPTVAWVNPTDGATLDGTDVLIQIAASDTEDDASLGAGNLIVEWQIDGGAWQGTAYNGSSGNYEADWLAPADGDYSLTARAEDSALNQTTQAINVRVSSAPSADTTVSVEDPIGCSGTGGRNNDKHINIHVVILEQGTAIGVSGATVAVHVDLDGGPFWNGSGTTDDSGEVVFSLKNADPGTYTTTIDGVSGTGIVWDGAQPADNDCIKNSGGGVS